MFTNPLPRKLVQISEDALPPVHVPLVFNNDFYILTQQDVRKIEDTRLFSISKIMPNGDVKTLNAQDAAGWLQQYSTPESLLSNQIFSNFLEFLNNKRTCYQQSQQFTLPQMQQQYTAASEMPYTQPMEISPTAHNHTVASIEQQLQWNRSENISPPFPMHYSHGTSTTEINYKTDHSDLKAMEPCDCSKMCQQCEMRKKLHNKSTSTQELLKESSRNEVLDAREQLRRNKLCFSST